MRTKSVLTVLFGSMLFLACSLSSEEIASLAAKGYYDHLINGEYEQFLEGKDGLDRNAAEDYWKQLLDNSRVELAMLGSADPENAYQGFKKYFADKPRKTGGTTTVVKDIPEIKRITETEEISQSKLVMGFRAAYPENKTQLVANSLMSAILGGTPTSKLFTNVREKQSLCYYCASRVDNSKGIMLVDSGVEIKNIEKTEEAVMEQLRLLKNGCITDDELNSAKLAIKNSYISSLDSLGALQSFYINGILLDKAMSPLEAAAIVDDISKDQITELAKQIKLDTVFSLIGN